MAIDQIDKNYLHGLLTNLGVDYAEIRLEETVGTGIQFIGSIPQSLSQDKIIGGCVRVLYRGGWSFVSFNSIEKLEKAVQMAVLNAKIIGNERKEKSMLASVEPSVVSIPLDVKNNPSDFSLEKKIDIVRGYVDLAMEAEVSQVMAGYADATKKSVFANSEGTYITRDSMKVQCLLSAMIVNQEGNFSQSVIAGSSNDFDSVLGLEEKIKEMTSNVLDISKASQVKGGTYTVLLSPKLAGTLIHEAFGHLLEADGLYENPEKQKIMKVGRKVGPKLFNVFDTGLTSGSLGYTPHDDEGVPGQKTWLVREGIIAGEMHSRETAGKMNRTPTGNARAINYAFPPIVRMRNTVIGQGDTSFKDMLSGIKNGLYCVDMTGGQTNTEEFTFTAAYGVRIEDGKLTDKVHSVTLKGNIFETLGNIRAIGDDLSFPGYSGGCGKANQSPLPVGMSAPHVLIDNVLIGGKQ